MLKPGFCQILRHCCQKCVLRETCTRNTTRSWKLCFNQVCVGNWLVLNFKLILPKRAYFVKSAQKIHLAPENCFSLVCVGNWILSNFKPLLPKNAFWVNLGQRISLAPKNCVLLPFMSESGFLQILSLCYKKMHLAWTSVKECDLLLKSAFYFSLC